MKKTGQALIEFMIGLVIVLVLVGGLVQFVSLFHAQTDSMTAARLKAGSAMFSNFYYSDNADYIEDVLVGADGSSYSADDTFTDGDVVNFRDKIIEKSVGDGTEWIIIDGISGDRLPRLRVSGNPSIDFGLVRGYDSRDVELLSATRNLLYRADKIEIRSEVWMPLSGGIY